MLVFDQSKGYGLMTLSDTIYNSVLAANTGKVIAVPAGARAMQVGSVSGGVFVGVSAAATAPAAPSVPAADVLDGTGMMIDPPASINIAGAKYILLVSATAQVVSLLFWAGNTQ